jgi:hypothetical protein
MSFDMITYTHELIERLNAQGALARAFGGIGIGLRCPSALRQPLARDYHDIDLATDRGHAHRLTAALMAEGFQPAERFNAMHGHSRMMFSLSNRAHMDVIVDDFVMCHKLRLRDRLHLHAETVSLADLLLTKLQIAQINHKDVLDLTALLIDHPLSADETGINVTYIADLLSNDWGWWRTVTANLDLVMRQVANIGLGVEETEAIRQRVQELTASIGSGKRSLRWKARARLGDRVAWHFEPEEVVT